MIIVLPATKEHIPLIQKIVDDTWPATYGSIISTAQISYMIDLFYSNAALEKQFASGHRFLLAVEDDQALGFAGFELDVEPQIAKLHKLYVLPNTQGKGIGILLSDSVINAATDANQASLILNVNRHNKAFVFYQKQGFSVLKEEDIDIGSGYFMNDYVMIKQLH